MHSTHKQREGNVTEKSKEKKLRRLADRNGYRIVKSRCRHWHFNNQGMYILIDITTNGAVLGWNYDADLDEIQGFLA